MWYRVFGRSDSKITSDDVLDCLRKRVPNLASDFTSEGEGWSRAELRYATSTPLHLERFTADEEGIRDELNTWAAFLETCDYDPRHVELMERMIQTRQLFTLRKPIDNADELLAEQLCVGLCQFLAGRSDGIWQADGEGFFAADGTLLLQEY